MLQPESVEVASTPLVGPAGTEHQETLLWQKHKQETGILKKNVQRKIYMSNF